MKRVPLSSRPAPSAVHSGYIRPLSYLQRRLPEAHHPKVRRCGLGRRQGHPQIHDGESVEGMGRSHIVEDVLVNNGRSVDHGGGVHGVNGGGSDGSPASADAERCQLAHLGLNTGVQQKRQPERGASLYPRTRFTTSGPSTSTTVTTTFGRRRHGPSRLRANGRHPRRHTHCTLPSETVVR